jgi:hypothetical protein
VRVGGGRAIAERVVHQHRRPRHSPSRSATAP